MAATFIAEIEEQVWPRFLSPIQAGLQAKAGRENPETSPSQERQAGGLRGSSRNERKKLSQYPRRQTVDHEE